MKPNRNKVRKVFIKFLKDRNIFDEFMEAFNDPYSISWRKDNEMQFSSFNAFINKIPIGSLVGNAFPWGRFSQNINWSIIFNEWIALSNHTNFTPELNDRIKII